MGLTCLFVLLLFAHGLWAKVAALGLFAAACATDWLDGRLARTRRQITPLGTLLDPIADKVLVLTAFLAFTMLRLIPAWMAGIIIGRELLVTAIRLAVNARGQVLPALAPGKLKTLSQMLAILLILVLLVARESAPRWSVLPPEDFASWMRRTIYGVTAVAVYFTIVSGLQFLWVHRRLLRHGPAR